MTKESAIQSYILANLKKIPNSEWIKPTTTNSNGTQDILGHIQGYFIAIEVKKNDGIAHPTKLQDYRIRKTNFLGAFSFWTTSWEHTYSRLCEFSQEKGISI